MVLIELNGKTVKFNNIIDWLEADEQAIIASNIGIHLNDPFFDIDASVAFIEEDFFSIQLPSIDDVVELDLDEEEFED